MTRLATIVAALALTAPNPLHAQAPRADTLTLTLEEAYRIAALSNPIYRQTVNATRLNGPETRAAWFDQILPSVSVNPLSTQYNGRLTQQATDFFGNPIENPESSYAVTSVTSQSISLAWTLQGANLFNYRTRQRLANRDRALAESAAMADLRTGVRRQFFTVLLERELLELERLLLDARRIDLDVVQQLFRVADKTRVDVLNAELGIEQQGLNINRQDRRYRQAILTLRTILGDVGLPALNLEAEDHPILDPSGLDTEELVDRAMDANAELRQGRALVESASHGVKESRTNWWPSLSASYIYGRYAQTQGQGALFDFTPENDTQSSFGIQLSLPFFGDYFQNKASIARAVVDLDNADEDLRRTRLAVAEEVRSAILTLRNQYESYQLAQRSFAIAEEALRLAREEYRLGTRTFEQLRESIDSEADARRQVIEADFGFQDGLVTLDEAVGAPLRAPLLGGRGG